MIRSTLAIFMVSLLSSQPAQAQNFEAALAKWVTQAETLISGVKVDTKQHSVSTRQTSVAMHGSAKALANTIVEMDTNIEVKNAITRSESMQYGLTGLCANVSMSSTSNVAANSDKRVRDAINGFETNWMQNGGSRPKMLAATQAIRRGAFCSSGELEQGLCEKDAEKMTGVVPAGDTNAMPWMLRRSYGTMEAEVGSIFVDTIAPPPTMKTVSQTRGNVKQMLERARARRQMALISMARGAMMDVVVRGLEGSPE